MEMVYSGEMIELLDDLKNIFMPCPPKIGEVRVLVENDPFIERNTVEVLDTKKGYVQYKFVSGPYSGLPKAQSLKVSQFNAFYKLEK